MIRTGIIGGAGYTAGELLRLLLNHPDVEIAWIQSSSNAGRRVTDVHQGIIGESFHRFTDTPVWDDVDVVFLCMAHGEARKFLAENDIPERVKIIDLSMDFRHNDGSHDFVYGLPELNRKPLVRGAVHVANPGCFATAIELALLPLAKEMHLEGDINVTAITGSTGAGVRPTATTHYSWRNDNVSVYKPLTHQHLAEINDTLRQLQPGWEGKVNFIPMRGPFSRGILAVVYLESSLDADQARRLFEDYYSDHNFTFVTDKAPDLKDVVNTNKCILHIDKIDGKLVITSVIDNLLKGAAGTAVHNMNLLFGLQERVGLLLKPSAF